MPDRWADYPFPLISTPAVSGGDYKDQFVKSSSKMALMHNVIIRGLNCMYLQAEFITPSTAQDFLTFCRCWCETINNHHHCEEAAYFPVIEKACGIEGISDSNVEQHDAFTPGLERFEEYIRKATPATVNGRTIIDLLDNFAAILQIHLTDEVVWILSLSKYKNLNLAAIDAQHGNYVRSHSSKTTLLPYLLTNHDLTYEGGIHDWWPSDSKVRLFFLRYICSIWNHGAWRYSSCSRSGKPKRLHGIDWNRIGNEHSLAMLAPQPAMVELLPQTPEPAYTSRPRSKESEDFAGAKHSRGRNESSRNSSHESIIDSSATTPRNSVGRLVMDDEKRGVGYSVLPPPVQHIHHNVHGHHAQAR